MNRVETLLEKLQQQFVNQQPASELLLTVQMLQAELIHLQNNQPHQTAANIYIPAQQTNPTNTFAKDAEEKIIEVLQVNEEEVVAELEEIKRNAAEIQQISYQNKNIVALESASLHEIPTFAHQPLPANAIKKEINDTAINSFTSLNDKLKQSKIDLGETLTDTPIRDLKKAIGVNDRFLFITELFRGDETMYERSIKTINSFSILPEAEYWIQRELKTKNGWGDNDVVKQFDQLVKRRFS
jgi:hypothetical protein